jgi:DNA-binding XRE family transcriptional regulator
MNYATGKFAMQLTWKTVDEWREERGMEKSELARRTGIPERTIYSGLRKESRLNAATRRVICQVFPEKFDEETGEVRQ